MKIDKSTIIPIVVFFASLLATLVAWKSLSDTLSDHSHHFLEQGVTDIEDRITERVVAYQSLLYGAVGLFGASQEVTREEWSEFIENSGIVEKFPGLEAVGFLRDIKLFEKDAYEQDIRNQGLPGFKIYPEGIRGQYAPVTYISPTDEDNLKVLGFDTYTDLTRREAIEYARDTGEIAITKKIVLVQDMDTAAPAFLFVLPVYEKGKSLDTVEERQAAVYGYVAAVMRYDDFIEGVQLNSVPGLDFQIFDGISGTLSDSNLTYSTDNRINQPGYLGEQDTLTEIKWPNHVWTMRYVVEPGFGLTTFERFLPTLLLLLGLLLTIGLTIVVRVSLSHGESSLRATRLQSQVLAGRLKEEDVVLDSLDQGVIATDITGVINVVNDKAEQKFGYIEGELIKQHPFITLVDENFLKGLAEELTNKTGITTKPGFDCLITDALVEGKVERDVVYLTKSRVQLKLKTAIQPLFDDKNQLAGYKFMFI